jgi:hypothetical protein
MPPKKQQGPQTGVQLVEGAAPEQPSGYQPLRPNFLQQILLDCPVNDIVFAGTAKGTGKSVGCVLRIMQLCALQKDKFHCLVTRATYQSLQELQGLLLSHLSRNFPGTTYSASDSTFRVGGKDAPFGTIELAYTASSPVEQIRAQNRLQGRSFSYHIHDEVGNSVTGMEFYDVLMGALRAPPGIQTGALFLANPGGPAMSALKQRFWHPAGCPGPGHPVRFWSEHYERHCIFLSAASSTNEFLNIAEYKRSVEMMAGGDADLLGALLYGDWGADLGGAFFASQWSPMKQRFNVKPGEINLRQAQAFVAMDWGSASPSAAYLMAPNPPNMPKGSIAILDECYICRTDVGGSRDYNRGVYMSNQEQASTIIEWLDPWLQPHGLTVRDIKILMDDAQFANIGIENQGCIAGDFQKAGLPVRKAEKLLTREANGLAVLRSRLSATRKDSEHPWLVWDPRCEAWEATMPTLTANPSRPEELAPGSCNHACDAVRMGVTWWERKWRTGASSFRVY